MCDLCNNDPKIREKARKRQENIAIELRKLADYLMSVSKGMLDPHSIQAGTIGLLAKNVIRDLVEEWL